MPYYIKRTPKKKKEKPLPLFDKAGIKIQKKPDLKAKLDKEFSLFIRLRDCMPNGYFRCISCGQIKPFEQADCGHYFSRTHLATRQTKRIVMLNAATATGLKQTIWKVTE